MELSLGGLALSVLMAVSALPAKASHLPTPGFPHPGQVERCLATNPENSPAFGLLPPDQQAALLAFWHSQRDAVLNN